MIKAVFWDLGGTICRTDGGGKILGTVRMAMAIKPFCDNFFQTLSKVITMINLYQARKKAGEKEPRMDDLLKEVFQYPPGKRQALANAINQGALKYATPLPGIYEALAFLGQLNLPMALVSDGFYGPEFVWAVLEQLRIRERFRKVITSCEVGLAKPHPQIFLTACREMNVRPEEVIFIGDREDRDIAGAAAVGMKTVLVGKRPKKTRPDLYLKNLFLLEQALPRLLADS